ncbi:MAG: L,D-transpeptidase family protein [Terrimonas sp.]|nr:L,D-transpeptidase family protein [Terrimonas sp.]
MKLRTFFYCIPAVPNLFYAVLLVPSLFMIGACNNTTIPKEEIVNNREQINEKAGTLINELVTKAITDSGRVADSFTIFQPDLVKRVYDKRTYKPIWSDKDSLFPIADTLLSYIHNAMENGLFPQNYHVTAIDTVFAKIKNDSTDAIASRDALLWAKKDVLLTDAFVQMMMDIKRGRLPDDSITLRKDTLFSPDLLLDQFDFFLRGKSMKNIITQLEPKLAGYKELKAGIRHFLDQADFNRDITLIPYPESDSADLNNKVFRRMQEEGIIPDSAVFENEAQLTKAIKIFQKKNNLTDDGKIGAQTAKRLNSSDRDRFLQLAITLDRYKQLPDSMPEKYLWVNIPAYKLSLFVDGAVKLESKVVVGKPITRTPVLNSAVSQLITYPQWTIPTSIIVKEILPGLKRSPDYLEKKGYSLVSNNGEDIDPYAIDWNKYSKGIPYKVVQGSGDANALGVMKFNFNNKYSVYLHDTNQRFFFNRAERALSHGCVRVQAWKQVSDYILQNDSVQAMQNNNRSFLPSDSVYHWLQNKEKHVINVRNRIPLFIRYFTCEGKDGNIEFYDDVYNEDSLLKKYYISGNK